MSHAAPPGWRMQVFRALASTQDAALDAARSGDPGGLAVMAQEQSAGRGRAGRTWEAPSGNLNLSALLRPYEMRPEPGFWALLAGVALHEAVSARAGDIEGLQLKWPNDLMLGEAKLGGVLIDSAVGASGFLDWVVIGMGVNIARSPSIAGRQTACVPEAGPPEALANEILGQLDNWLVAGSAAVREGWLARAHPCGTILHVRAATGPLVGAFAGISQYGELLLHGSPPIASAETAFSGAA